MDVASRPLPCMPTPTIPNRTRSLGATRRTPSRLAAKEAPAAAALVSRNSRRDQFFLLIGLSREVQVEPSKMGCEPEGRSEEHTSELQSQSNLVCRLLLEKKKTYSAPHHIFLQSSATALATSAPSRSRFIT